MRVSLLIFLIVITDPYANIEYEFPTLYEFHQEIEGDLIEIVEPEETDEEKKMLKILERIAQTHPFAYL